MAEYPIKNYLTIPQNIIKFSFRLLKCGITCSGNKYFHFFFFKNEFALRKFLGFADVQLGLKLNPKQNAHIFNFYSSFQFEID